MKALRKDTPLKETSYQWIIKIIDRSFIMFRRIWSLFLEKSTFWEDKWWANPADFGPMIYGKSSWKAESTPRDVFTWFLELLMITKKQASKKWQILSLNSNLFCQRILLIKYRWPNRYLERKSMLKCRAWLRKKFRICAKWQILKHSMPFWEHS